MTKNSTGVRFGVSLRTTPDPTRRDPFAGLYEQCQLAEELGYDFVAVEHHRFSPDHDAPSAPLMVLAAIAARTNTIRLVTSVLLTPLHHALDLAEQIATLDQLSNGRVTIGMGLGYRPYEYEHAGIPYSSRGSRMEEALEILRQAWTQPTVTFHGRHYDINGAAVIPEPVQQPHPPIWLGAQAKPGIDRTARLADGWMADYMQPASVVQRRSSLYRGLAEGLGRPSTVCLLRQVAVGTSRQDVTETWLPSAQENFLYYWQAGGRWPGGEVLADKLARKELVSLEEFTSGRDIAGSPSDCVEQIQAFHRTTRFDYFLAAFGGKGDSDAQLAATELFGREVIPAFT